MKVKYKTIVHVEDEEYNGYLPLDKQEWCCKELEGAVSLRAVEVQCKELLLTEPDPYDSGFSVHWTPVKFCPFCGEQVESEETKRVERVLRNRTIKAQPARQEKHWVEIPIVGDKL